MTNPRLKPKAKAAWLAALPEYEQGTGHLRYTYGGAVKHCCLGVLCEAAIKAGVPLTVEEEETGSALKVTTFDGQTQFLPEAVMDWAFEPGTHPDHDLEVQWEDDYQQRTDTLVDLNDGGYTFEEIGRIIEEFL
jgi:hypothetical protein